jgi:MFS family permease
MLNPQEQPDEAPTAELVSRALSDMRELARVEVALAVKEVETEARGAVIAIIVGSASIAAMLVAIALGLGAIITGLGGSVVEALGWSAGVFAVAAGIGLAVTYAELPKHPLLGTRRRIAGDLAQLKDHLA